MHVSEKWRRYYQDPFGTFDNLDLNFHGVNFNIFQKSRFVASTMLWFSIIMAILWSACGFDSNPGQLIHVLYQLPAYFQGQVTVPDLFRTYTFYYGKEMHYSAFVIYGIMFWALSVHMDQGLIHWFLNLIGGETMFVRDSGLGISKSKNILYAAGLTLFAGGTFELFWILSFAYFQGQLWVATFHGSQLWILLQDIAFAAVGTMVIVYMWADCFVQAGSDFKRRWRFNWSLRSWLLIVLTVALIELWWFYPGQVQHVAVVLTNGQVWQSSHFFPQTLYTIQTTPGAGSGQWFYVPNDLVHALNTAVKLFMALCVAWVGMLQKVDPKHEKL